MSLEFHYASPHSQNSENTKLTMENTNSNITTRCNCCKLECDEDLLVLCDGCDRAYHTYCMTGCDCCGKVPNKQFKKVMEVPDGDWYCKHCRDHLPSLPVGEKSKCIMYGWGDNTTGCLGSGLPHQVISTPTILSDVAASNIVSFDVGDDVSVVVDVDGGVYTCGNGNSGVLGHPDIVHEILDHFRRVDFFQTSKISKGEGSINQVVCSADNIYAITRAGHLYGWGGNAQGELGHMDYKPKRLPKKNSAFREMNLQVKQLVTGDHHALVLTDEPSVYAMGENTLRQLGVSNNSLEWTPKMLCQEWKHDRTVVEEPDFPRGVTRVFAGGNTSMCIDKKGNTFIWGLDLLKRSAAGASVSFMTVRNFIAYPQLTDMFQNIAVKDVAIGSSHIVVLTEQGEVLVAGENTKGQLGQGDSAITFSKDFLKVNVPSKMTGIFADGYVSGCFGPSGIYMWGNGKSVLIPRETPSDEDVKTPLLIALKDVKNVKTSNTHIIIMCNSASESKKREATEQEEEENKKQRVEA